MEELEFLKEEIRFCREQEGCSNCKASSYCSFLNRPRNLTNDCIERRVSIIEDWSEDHPVVTNAQKFVEVFWQHSISDLTIYEIRPISHEIIPIKSNWWNEPYEEPQKS